MRLTDWWIRRYGSRRYEQAFLAEWGDLARYNAEVAAGIVHTPEYNARMRHKQAAYDARPRP